MERKFLYLFGVFHKVQKRIVLDTMVAEVGSGPTHLATLD